MKKLIVIAVLFSAVGVAHAGMVKVSESAAAETYIDVNTLQKKGQIRNIWTRVHYKRPIISGKDRVHSVKAYASYDCNKRVFVLSKTIAYGDSGNVLWTDNEISPATPIDANGEAELKAVCSL